jgi:transposase
MEAYDFESVEQDEKKILLNVCMKRRAQECPACRTPCDQVHDYRLQRVKDSPIQGKAVIWQYRKRRYRCPCCGKRFYLLIRTLQNSQIYDYLRAFPNRNQVQYFVMDMNREYLDIAKKLLLNARIVIDRFHVVRYCTWALENVRKRVQMKLLPEQRKYFKRSRKLLLAHMHDLSAENKAAVERMLLLSRDLREAYLLKEVFYDFMDASSSLQAKERLRAFHAHALVADLPEFSACLTMLKNWEPYILNAFDCPYSNGFTEGVNNKIKVLKRIAFGYRSFRNFRTRILCMTNG